MDIWSVIVIVAAFYLATFLCTLWLAKVIKETNTEYCNWVSQRLLAEFDYTRTVFKGVQDAINILERKLDADIELRLANDRRMDDMWERLLQVKVGQVTGDLTPVMASSIRRMHEVRKQQETESPEVRMPDAEACDDESFEIGATRA